MRPLIALTALTLLAACGTRGPLELPPGPPPPPLLGAPSPSGSGSGSLSNTPNQTQGDHSNKAAPAKQ